MTDLLQAISANPVGAFYAILFVVAGLLAVTALVLWHVDNQPYRRPARRSRRNRRNQR